MEQELLVTCDPAVVKDLVQKVASKVGNNQAVFLTDMVCADRILLAVAESQFIGTSLDVVHYNLL